MGAPFGKPAPEHRQAACFALQARPSFDAELEFFGILGGRVSMRIVGISVTDVKNLVRVCQKWIRSVRFTA